MADAYDYQNYQYLAIPKLRWMQDDDPEDSLASNSTDEKKLWNRGMSESFVWQTSQISAPKDTDWLGDTTYSTQPPEGVDPKDFQRHHRYYFEDDPGAGQYIYILEAAVDQNVAVSGFLGTAGYDEATTNFLMTNRASPTTKRLKCLIMGQMPNATRHTALQLPPVRLVRTLALLQAPQSSSLKLGKVDLKLGTKGLTRRIIASKSSSWPSSQFSMM